MTFPHTITTWRPGAATFDANGNPSSQPRTISYQGPCFRQDPPRGFRTMPVGDESRVATEVCYLPRGEHDVAVDDRFDVGDFEGRIVERTHARGRFYTRLSLMRDG